VTPAQQLVAPVEWRERAVQVNSRRWAYRESGDGETVLLLDPPGRGGSGAGPLEQLADRYRLIETTCAADDGSAGAVEDPPARRAARLVRQFAEAAGCDRFAVISRGAATSVALWLAIEDPATVTTLVLESPPPLDEDAAFRDGPHGALLAAMPSLEVPTLVLLGEGVEPGLREQLSTYKRLLPASTAALVYDAGEDVRGDRPSAYMSAVTEYLERGQAFVVNDRSTVIHA
jgi:pimeloyl-ACP methyl ester carboxylesterase